MRVFKSIDVAASSLTAHRLWMDTISQNLANVNSSRTPEGGPYVRRVPVFQQILDEIGEDSKVKGGVKVVEIAKDTTTAPRLVYQPDHPDADQEGYVAMPNVSVVREMADMMVASRAYEANLAVTTSAKSMWTGALDILKG
ncbi:MAG: flagellar basal body rod protein FlgC [Synergistota bacterium]|nr:flagellar basal body rod protein FlgC [Synergistota bacterium]